MSVQTTDLQSQPFFDALTETELQYLCESGVTQTYRKGKFLIREGSLNHYLFYIVKGSVHIKSYGVKVATLSPGELMGEISASGLDSPIADVTATSSVTVYKFPVEAVRQIAAENKTFAKSLRDKAMSRVLQ